MGPARASAPAAVQDVLAPLLSGGALALGAVWALAAVVLPWVVRGRSAGADVVGAALWAAGLAAAAGAVAAALPWDGSPPAVRGLVASAVVAGILAVLARAVRDS
jgi:CHASE2 domain-containing sensor protein